MVTVICQAQSSLLSKELLLYAFSLALKEEVLVKGIYPLVLLWNQSKFLNSYDLELLPTGPLLLMEAKNDFLLDATCSFP